MDFKVATKILTLKFLSSTIATSTIASKRFFLQYYMKSETANFDLADIMHSLLHISLIFIDMIEFEWLRN